MFVLPRTREDFLKTEYWDSFFKKRGKEAFEWYGEYEELCGILHRYIKPIDKILVIGCGNSAVSSNLYDLGYKDITNIDVSGVVIKRMQQKYGRNRPGLCYLQMDALHTSFPSSSFSTIFDKGTLDALFPNNEPESLDRIKSLFGEIERLLKFGGRYVCISLLQEHILKFILEYFFGKGWLIRVCRCVEVEKNRADGSCLPVFALVCTKMKKLPNIESVVEISMDDNNVARIGKDNLVKTILSIQQAEIVCNGLNRNCLSDPNEEAVIEIARPCDSSTRYTIMIADPSVPADIYKMTFAAFVVPQGKNDEWIFASVEGRQILRENCKVDRLALIFLHKDHDYPNFKEIQNELTDTVIKLAPKGVTDRGEKVTFLTISSEQKADNSVTRFKGKSIFSGEFLVQDVEVDGAIYRRLIFSNRDSAVQSEIRLLKDADKNTMVADFSYVNFDFCILFTIGVTLAVHDNPQGKHKLLLLGLGGGGLASLIYKLFKNVWITAVEIDEDIHQVALNYFFLKVDERLRVEITDGLIYLENGAKKGEKFDVIIFDVDNKDLKMGISCPPSAFLEPDTLQNVVECLSDTGLFLLNLVCRSAELKKTVYDKLKSLFAGVVILRTREHVNEIIMCWKRGRRIDEQSIKNAETTFYSWVKENSLKVDSDNLDITKCMETLQL